MTETDKIIEEATNRLVTFFEDTRAIEAELINTTNIRYSLMIGRTSLLSIGVCAYFGSFRTSYLTKIVKDGTNIIFTTRNSTYTFKDIDAEPHKIQSMPDGILFEMTQEEIKAIEEHLNNV